MIKTYLSNLAEQLLWLNGKPFSFEMFPPKRVIYDDPCKSIVQQTSRQVGKSTDLAALKVLHCVVYPFFKTLYIVPQSKHKSDFSHQRLSTLLEGSPIIKKKYLNYALVNNVDLKQLSNHSFMQLKHAYLTDLPLRGPSSDMNVWDEFQDANPDIYGIGQETLNRSTFKKTIVTGTPKSSITPLHRAWESSTKFEVFFKCTHCGHWNLPSLKHVQPHGPACEKCNGILEPDKWEWVLTGDPTAETNGYHYNKLGLAIFKDIATDWKKDVWNKIYGPEDQRKTLREFRNEVLGEVDDDSMRPINEQDIIECCSDRKALVEDDLSIKDFMQDKDFIEMKFPIYCAIDWGTSNTSTSNTVLVLGAPSLRKRDDDATVIKVFHIKRFTGEESSFDFILNYIYDLYRKYPNIVFFAADNGMGSATNSLIRSKFGPEKLFGFQFVANQKEKLKWHVVEGSAQEQYNAYYTVSKVIAFDQFFYEIKEGLWSFPNWSEFKTYAQEILNVEQEFNETKSKYIYTHKEQNPDDTATALIYLRLIIELGVSLLG